MNILGLKTHICAQRWKKWARDASAFPCPIWARFENSPTEKWIGPPKKWTSIFYRSLKLLKKTRSSEEISGFTLTKRNEKLRVDWSYIRGSKRTIFIIWRCVRSWLSRSNLMKSSTHLNFKYRKRTAQIFWDKYCLSRRRPIKPNSKKISCLKTFCQGPARRKTCQNS